MKSTPTFDIFFIKIHPIQKINFVETKMENATKNNPTIFVRK